MLRGTQTFFSMPNDFTSASTPWARYLPVWHFDILSMENKLETRYENRRCAYLTKSSSHPHPTFFYLWDTLKNFAKLNWFHHILTVSQQYPTQKNVGCGWET